MLFRSASLVSTNTGGRYDPGAQTWTTTTIAGAPSGASTHTAIWTGSQMIVLGNTARGGLYCASSNCTVATWYRDGDGDGYGNSTNNVLSCTQPAGYVAAGGDCNDADPLVHPGLNETCNGVDDDCDGVVDNGGGSLCTDNNQIGRAHV